MAFPVSPQCCWCKVPIPLPLRAQPKGNFGHIACYQEKFREMNFGDPAYAKDLADNVDFWTNLLVSPILFNRGISDLSGDLFSCVRAVDTEEILRQLSFLETRNARELCEELNQQNAILLQDLQAIAMSGEEAQNKIEQAKALPEMQDKIPYLIFKSPSGRLLMASWEQEEMRFHLMILNPIDHTWRLNDENCFNFNPDQFIQSVYKTFQIFYGAIGFTPVDSRFL